MGGSCAHSDPSRGLALVHNDANDLWVGASTPLLPFFILGGVPLHEGLVGRTLISPWYQSTV